MRLSSEDVTARLGVGLFDIFYLLQLGILEPARKDCRCGVSAYWTEEDVQRAESLLEEFGDIVSIVRTKARVRPGS